MKIGIVTRRYLPAEGGIENFLHLLLKYLSLHHTFSILAQLDGRTPEKPGIDDVFAPPAGRYDYDQQNIYLLGPTGIDRMRLLPCLLRLLPGLRRVGRHELRKWALDCFARVYEKRMLKAFQNVDIIHSFTFNGMGWCALRVARKLKCPFIITPFMHTGQWGDSPVDVGLYNQADSVIALHEGDRQALIAVGVEEKRIRTIGIGIEPICGNGPLLRRRYAVEGPLILFVGRMIPHKGYRELVDAVLSLRKQGEVLSLMLMGPASDSVAVDLSRLRSQGIHYLGHVSACEKADAYDACDLFCLPSDGEIMPVTILEAWSLARPILVGNIPALQALVEAGKTGMLVRRDPVAIREKLRSFLKDREGWGGMGAAGQQKLKTTFLIQDIAARHHDLYGRFFSGSESQPL